jgi:hypothetical protein
MGHGTQLFVVGHEQLRKNYEVFSSDARSSSEPHVNMAGG